MPPKAIPDRWIPYKACGEVIEGTRIICFKVPLNLNVQKNVREIKKIWDIPTVLADIPRLGAVIDLTNTARYYNPLDFLKANILHRKILMPGRVVPPESSVLEFMNTLDEFLAKNSESLVGVHCTHGLNRTGYMVCRYMRDRMGIPADEAITKFETARGYKMERDIYINSILGKPADTIADVKESEVIPVKPRRDDMNYRSPLDSYEDSPIVYNSNRFGNRDSPRVDRRDRFGNTDGPSVDSKNSLGSRDGPSVDSRNRFENSNGPNSDSRNRFGYKSNSDRSSSNRYSNQLKTKSDRSTSSSPFFKCYTDRCKDDKDFSARSKGETKKTNRPMSWRNHGEGSTNTRRQTNDNFNRKEDRPRSNDMSWRNHGESSTNTRRQTNDNFNRKEDRPRSNDRPRKYDNVRPNDNARIGEPSRPRLDYETRSGL